MKLALRRGKFHRAIPCGSPSQSRTRAPPQSSRQLLDYSRLSPAHPNPSHSPPYLPPSPASSSSPSQESATRSSSMDPAAPASRKRRSTSGKGEGRGGSRLGMKRASLRAPMPSPPPSSAAPTPTPPPPPTSAPAPSPVTSSICSPSVPTSSPAVPTVPPPQTQGSGWGPVPPMFPSQHGNQQAPNPWGYPPGGFLNFIQQQHYPPQPQVQGENFHLIGQAMSFNPISPAPPPPPTAYGTETSEARKQGNSMNEPANLDIDKEDNSEANMAVKKRYWTHEEEERLASSWLNCSKDPVKGNDKKGDTFWKEITFEFNKKGNGKRTREMNQLKVHWSRLKASITDFNDAWSQVTQVHTSGYSDDMLEEEAQKVYEGRFGKRFLLVHWWKKLKDEPKWCAQFETEKNKSEVPTVPEEQTRPIGREAAKAERSGKKKKQNAMEGIVILGDNIEKIVKMQQDRKVECEKITKAQIQISNANLKAATEQKQARMFEVYNSYLKQDTSQMSEVERASRDRVLSKLEEKLFAD